MKKILFSFFCLSLLTLSFLPSSNGYAKGLPQNYAEFNERCQTMAKSPDGAVKMYFDAVFAYLDPSKRNEAIKMLRYIMRQGANWERLPSFNTFVSRLNNQAYHHIFRSFAKGSSPENSYKMSVDNYNLDIVRIKKETDFTNVFLRSSGADSEKPVWVQKFNDGLWYVINNASTYVGVRPPVYQDDNSHDADYD